MPPHCSGLRLHECCSWWEGERDNIDPSQCERESDVRDSPNGPNRKMVFGLLFVVAEVGFSLQA